MGVFSVIAFHCENCGQKIKVLPAYAGKRGKCPKCGYLLVVPRIENIASENKQKKPVVVHEPDSLSSAQELQLKKEPPTQINIPNIIFADNFNVISEQQQIIKTDEAEKPPVRKLPRILDIFLYPASTSGLINLGIFWLLPVLLGFIRIIPISLVWITVLIVRFIVAAYMYYYLMECVRDSADGGIIAPDNMKSMPDSISDAISQLMKIIASIVIFWGPIAVYLIYQFWQSSAFNLKTDVIFWLLLGYGVFFYPMGLLAIAMFDSSSAFNPFLWIASIFSTFFQYCKLVLTFCFLGWLVSRVVFLLPQSRLLLYLFGGAIFIYLAMIATHLLGRFYYLNYKKLNWEV
jgi:hypothetical protein